APAVIMPAPFSGAPFGAPSPVCPGLAPLALLPVPLLPGGLLPLFAAPCVLPAGKFALLSLNGGTVGPSSPCAPGGALQAASRAQVPAARPASGEARRKLEQRRKQEGRTASMEPPKGEWLDVCRTRGRRHATRSAAEDGRAGANGHEKSAPTRVLRPFAARAARRCSARDPKDRTQGARRRLIASSSSCAGSCSRSGATSRGRGLLRRISSRRAVRVTPRRSATRCASEVLATPGTKA